jgi:hypothetical protein
MGNLSMNKKAYYIKSKTKAPHWANCDNCGRKISQIKDGVGYWNPDRKALKRNICGECFDEKLNPPRKERRFGYRVKGK